MDFNEINIWYWVLLVFIALICAYLGYLSGRKSYSGPTLEALRSKTTDLQLQLIKCQEKLVNAEVPMLVSAPFNSKAARAAFGKRIREDDLKLIEGIGPKIEGLFHNYEIKTWKALAETPVAKCQEVLNSGGDRYQVHDPASWPMQARMAYEGKWEALARWQEIHKHGKL